VTGATESELMALQTSSTVVCLPCVPGWQRVEVVAAEFPARLWTCQACEKDQYIVDPNQHVCQQCPAGAVCSEGTFTADDPADSVWEATQMGVYRLVRCPRGYVLVRDEDKPALDRCTPCPPYTYSIEEAVYGQKMSVGQGDEIVCNPCSRGKATCLGKDNVSPLPGFWSPLIDTPVRRLGHDSGKSANESRIIRMYRCVPPTACIQGNASYPHGLCMPGAYGPLCGICNETDGYAKSRDGCRRCNAKGVQQSTTAIAVWTGLLGVPIFLTFWYFFALWPLLNRGPGEEEDCQPEKTSEVWGRFKARLFFCAGRVSEHPIWRKTMAPVIGPAQALMSNCIAYVVRNNTKDYIKIIVSFYQVSTAFSSNIDVKWPDSVTSVWRFFAFLTMEIFKLYSLAVTGRIEHSICAQLLVQISALLSGAAETPCGVTLYERWRNEYLRDHGGRANRHKMAMQWQEIASLAPILDHRCEPVYILAVAQILGTCIMVYHTAKPEAPAASSRPKDSLSGLYLPFGSAQAREHKKLICLALVGKDCCYLRPVPESPASSGANVVIPPIRPPIPRIRAPSLGFSASRLDGAYVRVGCRACWRS
jgi:hypothetical protein